MRWENAVRGWMEEADKEGKKKEKERMEQGNNKRKKMKEKRT